MKKTLIAILPALLCLAAPSQGANLANPAAQIPDARLAIGVYYFLNGSTITNDTVPMIMNRAGGRVTFSPVRYVGIGGDLGVTKIGVDRVEPNPGNGRHDTIPAFDGYFGLSAGGHLKASTPFFFDYVSLFGAASGCLMFKSENVNNAYYGGKDAAGVIGIQVRIPKFGYISAGPHVYLILGESQSHNDKTQPGYHNGEISKYSNLNNVRGWLAIDYFPEMGSFTEKQKPYLSIEFSVSPKIGSSNRVPVQEFAVSFSIGAITQRLYGADKEADEW